MKWLLFLLAGCAEFETERMMRNSAAGTGCDPKFIKIESTDGVPANEAPQSWIASCNGKRYRCASPGPQESATCLPVK
jgi:hypothetical protein